jgi:dimethylhistidine N-methyltransferase
MAKRASAVAPAGDEAGSLAAHRDEIVAGLTAAQKRLSPKFLYDERGSLLFDEICTLPEYYATRTELSLLRHRGPEIAALVGPRAAVVELGAGSSVKARVLLGHLRQPERYLPVDISATYLDEQAAEVAASFPDVAVHPVPADFTAPFALPLPLDRERTLLFFPGSTIGNLSRMRAATLLSSLAERFGGALLLGVDVCLDPAVLHAAYNDSRGVTAAFNLNLLVRLNRELGGDFDVDSFEHRAVYDRPRARIEMRLVSRRAQTAHVAGVPIRFRAGEYIISEHSHKYSADEFAAMAAAAGWRQAAHWTDAAARFSLQFFRAA